MESVPDRARPDACAGEKGEPRRRQEPGVMADKRFNDLASSGSYSITSLILFSDAIGYKLWRAGQWHP